MIGESLLLLKGHSRSHMTCKALCPFQLKCVVVIVKVTRLIRSNNNVLLLLTVHKYVENNVDFNLFLNCCKLGNYVISLAKPFHMCIPLTVIDSSLWVVFDRFFNIK